MKRIIAGILFVIFVVPLCTTGLAAEPNRVETVLGEAERLAAVADESGDYTALIPVVETFYSDVMPALTEDQIVDIIKDDAGKEIAEKEQSGLLHNHIMGNGAAESLFCRFH